jgi:hypothetical protein
MNPDDLLSDVFDRAAEAKSVSMAAYEERVVKKMLGKAQLGDQAKQIAYRVKDLTGKARVNFSWFYSEYPDFPIWLGIRKVPYVHKLSVSDLFNKWSSLPFMQMWADLCDESPDSDKPVGLIFDWPGVKGTQLVLHNYKVDFDVNSLRIIRKIGQGKLAELVYLEQFEPFFDLVLDQWVR